MASSPTHSPGGIPHAASPTAWLTILGVGEEGLAGLSPSARVLFDQAELIVGGDRHLAMLPPEDVRPRLRWTSPIATSVETILQRRGQPICVLASGDPMCYGIGATLIRRLPVSEITIVPAPSAFSLACARLGWPAEEVEYLSLCGRDPALLTAVLYPGAQLLILSADRTTPATVASSLAQQGFGSSRLIVLERLGGPQERLLESRADTWATPEVADLNLIAVHCQLAEGLSTGGTLTTHYSRLPALPDSAYQHDGQLTKREVRAVTLSALAPLPGQLLWDIGAGCGSIGIEWMRSHPRCRAIAVEQHPTRLQYLANNALALGTPQLKIEAGKAPDVLRGLPQPAAIFIGGGMTQPRLLETCWEALPVGGRLVANAVTVEGELQLFQWQQQRGGELTRLAIQRAEPIGHFLGWKALAPVTQWVVVKSSLE